MKTTIIVSILLVSVASAEPFSSGKTGQMPAAGKGVRVPAAKSAAPQPTAQTAKPAKTNPDMASAIRQKAVSYYTAACSNGAVQVTPTLQAPQPMPGWEGRMRTSGTVRLVTRQNGRELEETRSFDAVTENGRIIDFTAH